MAFEDLLLTDGSDSASPSVFEGFGSQLSEVPTVGAYEDGLLAVLDRETGKDLLRSWDWLLGRGCTALITTGLGDVFFWSDGAIRWLDVQRAHVESVDREMSWFLDQFLSDPGVVAKVLRKSLLEDLVQLHRPLRYHEAFILKPWRLLGGLDHPDNYEIGHCGVYVDLVGQTIPQLERKGRPPDE